MIKLNPTVFLVALTIMTATLLNGCDFAVLAEDREVPALHDLDVTKKTLVFVEDHPTQGFRLPNIPPIIGSRIMYQLDQAEEYQEDETSQWQFTDQHAVHALAVDPDKFKKLSIYEIGRAVNAEQIIYVFIESASQRREGTLSRPQATVHVKVIDVVRGRRVFPVERPGGETDHVMTIETFYQTQDEFTRSDTDQVVRKLANIVGVEIAQLFYKHRMRTPNEHRLD